MTERKSTRAKKKVGGEKRATAPQQSINQRPEHSTPDDIGSPPANVRREQPPPVQTVKKILKAENDEAKTLKNVFKSNPDSQMKEFIKKAATTKTTQQTAKAINRTPAEAHPPAVAQELLDTDDDVADNLARLFKASKSYKNV